ncbi:carboxypeptidase regulatory-like domain-containing protein [Pyxidicoccus parkwayensis]|uniref:Carboxypeptidase regulatory-like domain-containing protein n=1 Tax=Pyxidicoccus parkwayensis TaxID=2813578 RepID=A0ABX7P5I4_9BACT|nr:carboxypeptidase regulatory-like domain-containing protein [Pyxidicoccus parkwaysis]QSQ25744.1 carboxypeptidase regulatory-like domain-containing protein [Pyxidicoccus parkwaysis]
MSPSPRFPSLLGPACALLLALAGCASGDEMDPGIRQDTPPQRTCAVDQDCPSAAFFFCDTAVARCAPACRTPDDCRAARRGEYALPECDSSPLGCQCDFNRCLPGVCAADSDCPGEKVCRDGACVNPPDVHEADACEVTPDVVVGRPGMSVAFTVWARTREGAPLVPHAGATWRSLAPAVAGEGTGLSATFVLGVPGEERDAVEARVGSATCRARVTVLPADVPVGGVRVLVVDELTGRPVPLATVAASSLLGSVTASTVTGPQGAAWVAAVGEVGLSVFHPDYGYLTLARHDATAARDVRVALRRNPLDRAGGVAGTFNRGTEPEASAQSLRLGVAGLSVPGLPAELSPEALLGPEREVEVSIGTSRRRLKLPSGAGVWLAGSSAMSVRAPGVAGVCDESPDGELEPEAAVRAGACGTRAAWALQGELPLRELPLNALEPGTDPLLLLGHMVPGSPRFTSTVRRDTRFSLAPTPVGASGTPDLDAVKYSQDVSFEEGGVRLAFPFAVRVPELPRYRGAYLDRAYVLATVAAPGRGLVPLGLGGAPNVSPADPNTDKDARLSDAGLVLVRMAPAHGGLEGQPYRLVVAATSGTARDDASSAVATTTLVADLPALDFDPTGSRPVDLHAGFLAIPEGARYNFDPAAYQGLAGRQFLADVDTRASLVRVVFTDRAGRRWTVLADPDQVREGLRVPLPPATVADRTYWGDATGSRARLQVEVLTVGGFTAKDRLGPSRLAAADGPGLEHTGTLTRAVSSLDVGRPAVTWLFPELEGQRLIRGSAVRVRVTGFRVGSGTGADGHVRLSLQGGSGCAGTVLLGDEDVSQGQGEVELRLPVACSGTGVTLTAELADTEGRPLRPPVAAVRGVDIP